MRSKIALIGLALVNLSVGGPCKPSSRTTVSSLPSSVGTTDVSETSTDSQTNFDSLTTQVPSLTLPEPSTTTQEEDIIITNAILGGSFASRDPNSPSGLTNFDASGNAEFHSGGCYKGDDSKDDGCAALSASGTSGTKRSFFGCFASIFQTVRSVPRRKYTVQFFYLINSASSQGCVASSKFGDTEFYSQPAANSGASWIRVLEQVEAISDLPTFAISLTCSGAGVGISSILVDSAFISDQVTPQNIDDFKLDLGGSSPIEIGSTTAVRAEESSSFITGPSRPTGTDGLENTSTVEPTPTSSSEVTSSAVADTKSNGSHESSEIETNLPVDRTSEGITDTTADGTSPTSLASEENSKETTGPVSQAIGYTSQPFTTSEPPQPTDSASQETRKAESTSPVSHETGSTSQPVTTSEPSQLTDTTAIRTSPTSLASGGTSKAETTGPVSQETGSTSQPFTTTEPSQPTESVCKPTCETIEDYYLHYDGFGCDLNGVFVDSDAIYTLPGEEVGSTQTHSYKSNDECAEICKTLPGCKSAGFQRLSGRCFFSNTLVTRDDVRDGRDSQMVHWFGMECFTCGCGSGDTSTSTIPTTAQVHEPTSFITTTTARATQPTNVCHNNRGQKCQINPPSVENNEYVCIRGGVFTGQTWTVPRSTYPMQESQEQCAAICDTLENCETSGFFGYENRCIFTTAKIRSDDFAASDPKYDDPGWDPRGAVWSHRSCWTCPTCVLSDAPLPKSPTCNYKPGDTCTRKSTIADGVVCNRKGTGPNAYGLDLSDYPNLDSPGKCAAICQKMRSCVGFGYGGGQCMFTRTTLAPGDFLDENPNGMIWDDPSCFECPGCST